MKRKRLGAAPPTPPLTLTVAPPPSEYYINCQRSGRWLIRRHKAPPCGGPRLTLRPSAQVLDWIENHGEAFLSKHTGVGKSLHRARALQKRHEDFEEVAQVANLPLCSALVLLSQLKERHEKLVIGSGPQCGRIFKVKILLCVFII